MLLLPRALMPPLRQMRKAPESQLEESFLCSKELVTGFLLLFSPLPYSALEMLIRLMRANSRFLLLAEHQLPQGGESKQSP